MLHQLVPQAPQHATYVWQACLPGGPPAPGLEKKPGKQPSSPSPASLVVPQANRPSKASTSACLCCGLRCFISWCHRLQSKMVTAGSVCSTYRRCVLVPSTIQLRMLSKRLYNFKPAAMQVRQDSQCVRSKHGTHNPDCWSRAKGTQRECPPHPTRTPAQHNLPCQVASASMLQGHRGLAGNSNTQEHAAKSATILQRQYGCISVPVPGSIALATTALPSGVNFQ